MQPSLRPCGVAADMDVTVGKRIIELDGLVLHTILHFCSADARDLKAVACVSSTCRAAAGVRLIRVPTKKTPPPLREPCANETL